MASNKKFTNYENFNKHLSLNDRINISTLISSHRNIDGSLNLPLKTFGEILQRDQTTISKEVKNKSSHFSYNPGTNIKKGRLYKICSLNENCINRDDFSITKGCSNYIPIKCKFTLSFPYVCNDCPKRGFCTYPKRYYNPESAMEQYKYNLVESRSFISLTVKELNELNEIVVPLLKKGQSFAHILSHTNLKLSQSTLYNYIHKGYLKVTKLDTIKMARLRTKPRKKSENSVYMKELKANRHYEDFKIFLAQHPELLLTQWDTVEGVKGGKLIFSIKIVQFQLQLFILIKNKEAINIVNALDELEQKLGFDLFKEIFGFALTDNGTEFSDLNGIMISKITKEIRTSIYFCNPQASYEKGSCENGHELLRRILPKGTSFDSLNQENLNLISSHINSYKRKSTDFSSPIEMFRAKFGYEVLSLLGLTYIPAEDVCLKPNILK